MALTVEEIKIKVTSEDSGLKKLNTEITQLEAKIKSLQASPRGNVSNFKWFKDMEATLQNAKIAQQQLTQSNSTYLQSMQGVTAGIQDMVAGYIALQGAQKLWQISLDSAKFEVLRANFRGTTEDLEAFRVATAGTVDDANLIKLSNQATDLGIGLKEQAILFSLAEDAADKYGTSVEEGFSKVVMASEGNVKGLKSLGIQKEVYEAIVKDLAKAHGDEIDKLDAETQKQIRLEAIIKASGQTYEDATNKVKDNADKHEALLVTLKNLSLTWGGEFIASVTGVITVYRGLGFAAEQLGKVLEMQKNIILSSVNAWDGVLEKIPIVGDAVSWLADRYRDLAGAQSQGADMIDAPDAGEDFVKSFSEQDAINQSPTKKVGGLTSKTKKSGVGNKSIKETTELLKNLGREAQSVSGALLTIAQLDLSKIQPLVMAEEFSVVRQRIVEESELMQEALANFADSTATAMGAFFGSFVPPQNALTPIQQMLKTILTNAITTAQGLLFAGSAASFFKAILTGGISLTTDVAFKIAGFAALEAAKGFLGAFKDGSDILKVAGSRSSDSGFARVSDGEMIMNAVAVQRNYPALQAMQRGQTIGGGDSGVFISGDVAGMLKIHKKNTRDLRQLNKWKRY